MAADKEKPSSAGSSGEAKEDKKSKSKAQEDGKSTDSVRGNVTQREMVTELKESYIDYAMSVIVARALPDVRDGLKPVHRRILYAMMETGLRSNTKHRKSMAVVGEVLKSYHPHGDIAVYESLARMAQDFNMRYTLVDGQGNFGCFTKETKIKLTDGRSLSFGELIKEQSEGKRHWTFSFNHKTNKWEYTHKIVSNSCDIEIHESAGHELFDIIHHKDCNKLNNDPTNLMRMGNTAREQPTSTSMSHPPATTGRKRSKCLPPRTRSSRLPPNGIPSA